MGSIVGRMVCVKIIIRNQMVDPDNSIFIQGLETSLPYNKQDQEGWEEV